MRILIAGILGGIAMYVWSSLAHVALPLGQMGISTMPNEAAATAALSSALGDKDGLYLFPASMTAKSGPSGLLAYHKALTQMDASTLGSEGAVEVLQSILAAVLLGMSGVTGFGRRVGFVTLIGVVAAIATSPSYWIWYKFPANYTVAYIIIQVVEYLVAGVVIAAVLGRRAKAA